MILEDDQARDLARKFFRDYSGNAMHQLEIANSIVYDVLSTLSDKGLSEDSPLVLALKRRVHFRMQHLCSTDALSAIQDAVLHNFEQNSFPIPPQQLLHSILHESTEVIAQ